MNINEMDWHDSQIEKITIEYDKAELLVLADPEGWYVITCTGLLGMTDLCIWDDMSLDNIQLELADKENDPYLQLVFSKYGKNYAVCEKDLTKDIYILTAKVINNIPAKIYCQNIEVTPTDYEPEWWQEFHNPTSGRD